MVHATAIPVSDSPNLDDAIAGFLTGYSNPNTLRSYGLSLRQWIVWCAEQNVDPLQITRVHAEQWMRDLEAAGRTPATVDVKITAVRCFYQWCEGEEVLPVDPTRRVKGPKIPKGEPQPWLTRSELADFLAAAEVEGGDVYALMCLLILNGLRITEACSPDVKDLRGQRWHRTLMVTRKGGDRQEIALAPRTAYAIDEALAGRTEGPLLVNQWGNRMRRANATLSIRRICRIIKIDKPISPHDLRRSAITALLDAGVPLRDVSAIFADHTDPKVTLKNYDMSRNNVDRHPTYALSSMLA